MATTAKKLSEFYGINEATFNKLDILDAFLDIDSHFFLDPLLLKSSKIPEFKNSRDKIEKYFIDLIKLLKNYDNPLAATEVRKRLLFKEVKGVAIGHGSSTNDGNGIGPKLRNKMVNRSLNLVKLGVEDPALFEMIGFFEEDFGPDRLSDMAISIIRHDIFAFSERIAKELGIKRLITYKTEIRDYMLPIHPRGRKAVIFIPKSFLVDLPVAKSWEDISHIAWFNSALRTRLNNFVNQIWKRLNQKTQQEQLRKLLISNADAATDFLSDFRKYKAEPYDFKTDPKGEILWLQYSREIAKKYPVELELADAPQIEDITEVVDKIVSQFKSHIENHGWNELLYEKRGKFYVGRKNERNSQLLFYGIADSYCEANNLDINRELSAGGGFVDFKFSNGYKLRFVVELKLSSNGNIVSGYTKQLPAYEESEQSVGSAYVIIQVTNTKTSRDNINEVLRLEKEAKKDGKLYPKVYVIDGLIKPSPSKRH